MVVLASFTDPSKVSTNQNWVAGSMSLVSLKAPTVALFDENQKFHSFGYEAENNYSELALDEEHEKYYFFKRFKMRLHGKKIQRDIEIDDDRGRKMTAMLAGIEGGQLSIALEPEAASLYCQLIPTNKIHGSEGAKFAVASPGTKYMVIDLGDFLDLQRELETKKRTIKPESSGKITIKVPVTIVQTYEKESEESIDDAISGSNYNGKIKWMGDKMRIEAPVFKNLFKSCSDKIRYIQEGETVRVGEARSGKHVTLKSSQKEMLLKIFASPKREPMYVDEEDCETLGKVVVNLPDSEEKIRVEVKMMFGETELTVEAQELSTHTKYRAYFDFM
ncbi:HS12B-like protein [Mya arenaria]|uniref:HS12B-like protein n=1 Tax=Mya arenaria TaxID=6604 RepID=A0ABY7DUU5_MYAAR|nr:HS12B-like protein [Mya arenaria]